MRETFTIGNRVQVGASGHHGHFATLRFIGDLEGQAGTWYGVEWDEKERGKHKGNYNGRSYFTLRDVKDGSGSFVREKHLKRGIGVIEAISKRYMPIGKIDDSPDVINFFNMGGKEIQFYNRSKDGHCHVPKDQAWNLYQTDIDLSTYPVAFLEGSPEQLIDWFPRVTYINLSKSLIEDINVPVEILTGMPNITSINLSLNEFRVRNLHVITEKFPKVEKFYCDAVNLSFKEFLAVADLFPNLKTASFAANSLLGLSIPPKGSLEKLESLALQQCEISDWSQVQKFGYLPSLKMLNLLDNGIKSIELPVEATNMGFANLEMLILAGNGIENWRNLCALSFLPKLSNIVLYENPVCDLNSKRFRDEVIARLPHLTILNKTEIPKEERRSASILYIKMYYENWIKAGGSNSTAGLSKDKIDKAFLELHPTYFDLFCDLSEGMALSADNNSGKIKSQMIKVQVVLRKHVNGSEGKSEETQISQIKMLSSMTVSKVKLLMTRLLKVPPSQPMALFFRPHQFPEYEYSLESDLKTLSYYTVEDTDTIVVQLET